MNNWNLMNFNISSITEKISSHFYQIDKKKLLNLPRPIIFSIISNEHLKIENEDSLLDFIQEIFSKSNEDEENQSTNSYATFLEQISIEKLSDDKFRELILCLKPMNLTNDLWHNICKRFMTNHSSSSESDTSRYYKNPCKQFLYDGNDQNQFKGIIRHLTNECGGNVHEKGVVKVTESSVYDSCYHAFNLVDLDNLYSRFLSKSENDSWAQYDFVERKVKPTHYSIRSRPNSKRDWHPKGWVVEGSNTGQNDWKVLDWRSEVSSLDAPSASSTFNIQQKLGNDEFYRYIRIRQTEENTNGNYIFAFSALEIFGYII